MIAYVEGILAQLEASYAIVDIGGLGYHVRISLNTFSQLKGHTGKCKLYTHLHIKEDAHTLFGFFEQVEKRVFLDLLSVNGVGPSTALMMLSSLTAQEVQQAIASEDIRIVQSIKGIGAKTAQRLILELKDKMKKEALLPLETGGTVAGIHNTKRNEALTALVTLGIARNTAEKHVDTILRKEGDQVTLEQLIKLALKMA